MKANTAAFVVVFLTGLVFGVLFGYSFAERNNAVNVSMLSSGPATKAQISGEVSSGMSNIAEDSMHGKNWNGSGDEESLYELGLRLGLGDPGVAMSTLNGLRRLPDREIFLESLVDSMAERDPLMCLQFLQQLPAGSLRDAGFVQAFEMIAETDPALAATKASQLLQGETAYDALMGISNVWADSDPASALEWVVAQRPGRTRAAAIELIASTWAINNPKEALQGMGSTSGLSADEKSIATQAVLASWVLDAPQTAIAWAKENLRGDESRELLGDLYSQWAEVDPAAAAAALVGEKGSGILGETAPEIAGLWGGQDPSAAARWAVGIPDAGARIAAMQTVAGEWYRVDQKSAINWAKNLPEADGLRQSALDAIKAEAVRIEEDQ